jgi:hypothetical protein
MHGLTGFLAMFILARSSGGEALTTNDVFDKRSTIFLFSNEE